jgi:hypothetical protein
VRGAGITEKEQKIHGHIGDIEALDIFLAGIYKSKPRYYSRNLSYLIHRMYGYRPEILHEALLQCLTCNAYNAKMLIESSESIRMSRSLSMEKTASKTSVSSPLADVTPERTPINSFEQYF